MALGIRTSAERGVQRAAEAASPISVRNYPIKSINAISLLQLLASRPVGRLCSLVCSVAASPLPLEAIPAWPFLPLSLSLSLSRTQTFLPVFLSLSQGHIRT